MSLDCVARAAAIPRRGRAARRTTVFAYRGPFAPKRRTGDFMLAAPHVLHAFRLGGDNDAPFDASRSPTPVRVRAAVANKMYVIVNVAECETAVCVASCASPDANTRYLIGLANLASHYVLDLTGRGTAPSAATDNAAAAAAANPQDGFRIQLEREIAAIAGGALLRAGSPRAVPLRVSVLAECDTVLDLVTESIACSPLAHVASERKLLIFDGPGTVVNADGVPGILHSLVLSEATTQDARHERAGAAEDAEAARGVMRGTVLRLYRDLGVACVAVTRGTVRVGDTLRFAGHPDRLVGTVASIRDFGEAAAHTLLVPKNGAAKDPAPAAVPVNPSAFDRVLAGEGAVVSVALRQANDAVVNLRMPPSQHDRFSVVEGNVLPAPVAYALVEAPKAAMAGFLQWPKDQANAWPRITYVHGVGGEAFGQLLLVREKPGDPANAIALLRLATQAAVLITDEFCGGSSLLLEMHCGQPGMADPLLGVEIRACWRKFASVPAFLENRHAEVVAAAKQCTLIAQLLAGFLDLAELGSDKKQSPPTWLCPRQVPPHVPGFADVYSAVAAMLHRDRLAEWCTPLTILTPLSAPNPAANGKALPVSMLVSAAQKMPRHAFVELLQTLANARASAVRSSSLVAGVSAPFPWLPYEDAKKRPACAALDWNLQLPGTSSAMSAMPAWSPAPLLEETLVAAKPLGRGVALEVLKAFLPLDDSRAVERKLFWWAVSAEHYHTLAALSNSTFTLVAVEALLAFFSATTENVPPAVLALWLPRVAASCRLAGVPIGPRSAAAALYKHWNLQYWTAFFSNDARGLVLAGMSRQLARIFRRLANVFTHLVVLRIAQYIVG
jgi:hypothetical protein